MTENIEDTDARPHYAVDIIAFVAALIAAPLLVTVLGCVLVVPVFALILGAPVYLIVGTPLLLWHLSRRPARAGDIACLAFAANAALVIAASGAARFAPRGTIDDSIPYLLAIGLIFAPIWGATFAYLYRAFMNPLYRDAMQ